MARLTNHLNDEESLRLAIQILWYKGHLNYKLKPVQEKMMNDIFQWNGMKYVIKCARRLGKTYLLCVIAIQACLRKPNTQVRYAAPTQKMLKKFIVPIMRIIIDDCPEEIRPEFHKGDAVFVFKNGSEIHLAGVNNDNADSLRGTFADLFIIDEAGYIDDLNYLIDDVALPQFLDPSGKIVAGRRLIISGSPAKTPAHEFTQICRKAEIEGNLAHYDIYQGGYPQETIELYKKETGGEQSTTWKREYLALDVVDENYALVPEWKDQYIASPSLDEYFQFYQKYVSLDIGVRDLTVALFAHYDFQKSILYVHDEIAMNGPQMTTERLAEAIKQKELSIFRSHTVHKRVSDIDLLLLNDMRALHSLYFIPTDKGKLEEMVNEVRIWVNQGKVIVSPNCKQLIGCLAYGVWNENRTDFDRVPAYGHFDALASFMYMVRNVDRNINPIPANYGKKIDDYWLPDEPPRRNADKLKQAFNLR